MTIRSSLDVDVEVTTKEGDSSTERGALLETLAKRVLSSLQYDHVRTNVRVAGCELDVTAQDRQSSARILVECKAYRDRTISAEVLTKLMGTLSFHDEYKSGWLITTARLGKDAEGLVATFQQKPIAQRERLRVYDPARLVDLLVSTHQIVSPESLPLPPSTLVVASRTLLITDLGEFWAVAAVGQTSGVADTVLAFHAKDGTSITNPALLQQLAARDSNLRSLQWVSGAEELVAAGPLADASLRQELDSIAAVPVADDWSDYRPARPEDFVGRDDLLKAIIAFFEDVRSRDTQTRLLAIKAPSGWGKSSFLVKLKTLCTQGRSKDKVFLYAVDCRTASSPRYPELAVKRCFDEAVAAGFIRAQDAPFRVPSAAQPFADSTTRAALSELTEQRKVIVLFFDQFEEITTKQELADLFVQIKTLCSAIEAAGEPFVLGFSWKTDGSIPTDHPAYHVWHSFADRRREFELPLFTKRDISQLLGRLARELNAPVEQSLRRLLAEHCQGYPWLLKKLCVHVFRVLRSKPAMQRELLDRALDVQALFERDLSGLDGTQIACLERVAADSPADHFRVADQFGDPTVNALIALRLVVRNSGKLVLYWDIFRDYVLSKQVPAIPARYIPVSTPRVARLVMDALRSSSQISVLTKRLGRQHGTVDNVARDLVMLGVCAYDRKNARAKLLYHDDRESLAASFRFFNSHSLLRKAVAHYGKGFKAVPISALKSVWAAEFSADEYAEASVSSMCRRMITWFESFGILSVDESDAVSHRPDQTPPQDLDSWRTPGRNRDGRRLFVGEAPPSRVLEVLHKLRESGYSPDAADRNALYVLKSLRVVAPGAVPTLVERPPKGAESIWLASRVFAQPTVRLALSILRREPDAGAFEVGQQIANVLRKDLSEASVKRYASGILVWVNWLQQLSPGLLPPPRQAHL
jgi:hypothetical protein